MLGRDDEHEMSYGVTALNAAFTWSIAWMGKVFVNRMNDKETRQSGLDPSMMIVLPSVYII
jgi:hypothetical protein